MKNLLFTLLICAFAMTTATAQMQPPATPNGIEFKSVGPTVFSGRVADIDVSPLDPTHFYVAYASGGLWKSTSNGTDFEPLFDNEAVMTIGDIAVDWSSNTIWVGTGEVNSSRSSYAGVGMYKSTDGGKTWEHKGLGETHHIGRVIIHPNDPNTVWVAALGHLYSPNEERGVFKTTDGGNTWTKTLFVHPNAGAVDMIIDPSNPDILYASTWERKRSAWNFQESGVGSGIHKSTDGGETWKPLKSGIPNSNLGKIGLAMSPFNSDVVYAAIELDRRKGGVFMTKNGGTTWTKQSNAVGGGTGPHYYQESTDHGKTFTNMKRSNQHSDSHALVFKKSDPNYLLIGTDGGLYESFDNTNSWKYVRNLPITQYFKIDVDDALPFYNVYGGTQDNGSHAGPSRTISSDGIASADWWKTLGADGAQTATEPELIIQREKPFLSNHKQEKAILMNVLIGTHQFL